MESRYFIVCFSSKGKNGETYVQTFQGEYINRREFFESIRLDPDKSSITNIIELSKDDFNQYIDGWK